MSNYFIIKFLSSLNQKINEKFQLFNGVFGASDEVLGAIESGVDFEKRIVKIYQTLLVKSTI